MLYVIRDHKVYMKVRGKYIIEDFQQYLVKEDDRTNLVWNSKTQELEEPKPVSDEVVNPGATLTFYPQLVDIMRDKELWARIIDDGEKSLKLNIAVTLLIASVTTTQNVNDFRAALKKYINALEDSKLAKALTQKEKSELQSYIDQSKFHEVKIEEL